MSEQTFLLPDLGEGLTDAEVVRWLVAEGDVVTVDQVVVEVETAKSLVDVPTPYAGRVSRLHGEEGQTVDVGSPLISVSPVAAAAANPLDSSVEAVAAQTYREEEQAGSGNVLIGYGTTATASGHRRRRRGTGQSSTPTVGAPAPAPVGRVPLVVSPLVRRLARDTGVDLGQLARQTGGTVITRSAVLAAAERSTAPAAPSMVNPDVDAAGGAAPAPAEPERTTTAGELRIPLNGFRKAVSAVLTRSRAEIPEATVWVDVDVTDTWMLRERLKAAGGPAPSLMAFFGRFAVAGLRAHPVLNSRVDTDTSEIVQLERIDLGIAVQSPRGLVVPAVLDAGRMTMTELDSAIGDLTKRTRAGQATSEELAAGTFTVNNYGGFRVDGSAAIINYPEAAILGFGRIIDRPWVVEGEIVVRKIMQMSFVFDHRVCDGGTAAGFMRVVADSLESPASALTHL
ncbi:dihydrolipoamide acetyltransferase family protein [Klenkia taihuensis]|uniref:Dihydrolipoamide acetyltransferase component of pyruvate dehydrogenase complex n=1 Tax=Klenkia taihuensis TaxID=1225127 RepID=A0A1I1U496_9ACTN|nr:dihydrolipoamide acetyltransferase family protein [Klenkia taihuensis]GHE06942.1 dihydrolipoamide acetyltransferase component of pyruvate dehydrogenase complex [Klenkia taihuensis]SFD65632.1 pyruvate dehydrogenase E2 component (dihydrolipoamide acetyltransferase) [Klenkia taihuensis]